jgi:hypothetical protein
MVVIIKIELLPIALPISCLKLTFYSRVLLKHERLNIHFWKKINTIYIYWQLGCVDLPIKN